LTLLDDAASVDGAGGADVGGAPPSLSFVSPSSLSGAGTTTGGVGTVLVGAAFFFSSPSDS
jgi:hypothetical protein